MSNCNCICPEIDCQPVVSCINTELGKLVVDSSEFTNFCAAVTKCVDAQFEAISDGSSNDYNFFPQSIVKILQSFAGYTTIGDTFLSSDGTNFHWVESSAFGATYVDSGTGITVTGTGSSADPYKPNLNVVYVKGLFNSSNGLTYNNGATTLGGSLTQATTITGNNNNFTISGLNQGLMYGSTIQTKGSVSASVYGQGIFNGTQTLIQLISGPKIYSLDFNDISQILTLGTTQDVVIQDGTQVNNLVLGTNKTYFRIVNYHHKSIGDVLTLKDAITGEVEWTTPSSSGGSYTNEQAQDAVGNILTASGTISFTYNDSTPTITADLVNSGITYSKIQNVSTDKLLGRDSAGSGVVEELGVTGGIEFTGSGSIQTSSLTGDVTKTAGGTVTTIATNSVSNTKLRDSAGFSVIGKSTTGSGDPGDIVANTDEVLRRSGSGDLVFGSLVTNNIGNSQVTFSKIQNINTSKLIGRSTAGTGTVEELSIGNGLSLSGGTLSALGRNLIGITRFLTSGTWTRPVGCNAVIVYVTGAGGGGGGANAASSQLSSGSGGGGGGTRINYLTSGFGSSESITIGTGGDGGTSVNGYSGQNGSPSSFGSLVQAGGGEGGSSLTTGTAVGTGVGGDGSSGLGIPSGYIVSQSKGQRGGTAVRLSSTVGIPGMGGLSYWGYGGDSTPGAGGNGNIAANGATADGVAGANGVVIVYEYS